MMEDRITLGRKAFKALASDTRVSMLKLLVRRRMTLSELSSKLGMSVSTIKEHLDSLVSAGLIEQIDDGHKWKYYELTKAGREVVQPSDRRIMVLLGISAVAALFGMNGLVGRLSSAPARMLYASKDLAAAPMEAVLGGGPAAETAAEAAPELAPAGAAGARDMVAMLSGPFPYFELVLTVAALLVLGISIGWLYSRRR